MVWVGFGKLNPDPTPSKKVTGLTRSVSTTLLFADDRFWIYNTALLKSFHLMFSLVY
jgi:hypothetical protein